MNWKNSVAHLLIIVSVVAIPIVLFSNFEFLTPVKAYLAKPITEMSIGEFLFSIWFISALFSDRSK